jgi:uncharacterized membrane protein
MCMWYNNICCWMIVSLRQSICDWIALYYKAIAVNMKLERLLNRIQYVITSIVLCIVTVSLVLYGSLSQTYSSYSESYIWKVSAIYKSGLVPSVLILISFVVVFIVTINTYGTTSQSSNYQ